VLRMLSGATQDRDGVAGRADESGAALGQMDGPSDGEAVEVSAPSTTDQTAPPPDAVASAGPESPAPRSAPSPALLPGAFVSRLSTPAQESGPTAGADFDPGAGLAAVAGAPPAVAPPVDALAAMNPPQVPVAALLPPFRPLQLPDAGPTPHQDTAVAQIRAGYETATTRLGDALAQALARAADAVAEQLGILDTTAAAQISAVREGTATARADVLAEAGAAQDQLAQAASSGRQDVLDWRVGAVADADAALQDRQSRVVADGQQRAVQARQAADAAAQENLSVGQVQAQQARAIGAEKAASAPNEDAKVRAAQAAAAHELAGDTAGAVGTTAENTTSGMAAQGEQVAGALGNLADQVAADLTPHHLAIVEHLGEQETASLAGLANAVETGGRALSGRRDSALAALDRTESEAAAALQQHAAAHRDALVQGGQAAAEHLTALGTEAGEQLAASTEQAASLVGARPLDEQTTATATETVTSQLAAGADQLAAALDGRTGELTAALVAGAGDSAGHLESVGTDAADSLRQTGAQGTAAVVEATSATKDGLGRVTQQTRTAADGAVSAYTDVLDQNVAAALPGLDNLVTSHQANLGQQTAELRTKAAEPTGTLSPRIDTAQQRAAERAERSWLGNQLHDLWETVSSPQFLVGLAVGLLVGAIIILSAGTATPFLLVAAGVAAGAAGAAAGTMTGNIMAGKRGLAILDDVGRNALIGGLAGGVAAAVFVFGSAVVTGLGLTGAAATAGGVVTMEAAAVVSTVVGNIAGGRPWDENLLLAMLMAPLVELIGRAVGGAHEPAEGTEPQPGAPRQPGEPDEPVPGKTPTEEEEPGRRGGQSEGPEGVTDEDVHIEDANEPAPEPAEPELDPAICFPAGTLVATPQGRRPIEQLGAGGLVHAFDFATGTVVTRRILGLTRGSTTRWTTVRFAGETVRATPSHRFWVVSTQDWTPAEKLAPGMEIRSRDGSVATVVAVSEQAAAGPEATYNLSVEEAENYFVGSLDLLVHNITASRLQHLSRPGYRNYVLVDKEGEIYYSGMCRGDETEAGLAYRHGNNHNRFNSAEGDRVVFRPGTREYGEARLVEDRTAVDNDTIIGRDADNYRGNRQKPLSDEKMAEYLEYEQVKRGCG